MQRESEATSVELPVLFTDSSTIRKVLTHPLTARSCAENDDVIRKVWARDASIVFVSIGFVPGSFGKSVSC